MLLRILLTGLLGVLWDGVTAFGGVRLVNGENKCSGRVEHILVQAAEKSGCGHVQCSGHEASLTRCAVVLHSDAYCTHENDAGVICSGTLLMPTLTLLSPTHTVFSPGEAVRFGCSVLLGHHLSDFHLYKHGVSTTAGHSEGGAGPHPGGADPDRHRDFPPGQLQLSVQDQERLPPSAAQLSTQQLHQHHCGGTPNSPTLSSNEGYYYCLYRVQMGGRTFISRESQPLPIAIRDPDPVLKSDGDQLDCVQPDFCGDRRRYNHCGQGAVQQGEEAH
ncbi:hypothetical protein KUCAC02_012035 [Chaenocephalus aceratus]|uniref:Uncharacterized protein n=1 Tax=Chaenocephalus aceratus TaxID=36190 RepID=A0ACB9XA77_CHAAC|nr:hypothetical protein KUCAC02_012035 [Chaenocephalus aceratus]